mgnify:CR=1 FL=1
MPSFSRTVAAVSLLALVASILVPRDVAAHKAIAPPTDVQSYILSPPGSILRLRRAVAKAHKQHLRASRKEHRRADRSAQRQVQDGPWAVANGTFCNLCETVLAVASDLVENTTTREAFRHDMHEVCRAIFNSTSSASNLPEDARARLVGAWVEETTTSSSSLLLPSQRVAANRAERNNDDPSPPILDKICDDIVDGAIDIILRVSNYKPNIPNVACADFLHMCLQPCCDTDYVPEQVRLSMELDPTAAVMPTHWGPPVKQTMAIRVAWATLKLPFESRVRWWPTAGAPELFTATGTHRTYDIGGWEGFLHSAVMDGLHADTSYSYQVGGEPRGGDEPIVWSDVFTFRTMPSTVGDDATPLRFLTVTDMGWGPEAKDTQRRMMELIANGSTSSPLRTLTETMHLIVHPGDVGYADGDQHWWDVFGRELQNVTTRLPYMTGPGNHECVFYNCTAYKRRLWMPPALLPGQPRWNESGQPPRDAMYYAFTLSHTTFVMLDSETWLDTPYISPDQQAWLNATLAAAVARNDMVLVFMHRPLYCTSNGDVCTKEAKYLSSLLEATFLHFNVPIVFCGHVHDYERTFPVAYGNVSEGSPIYVVNGGAGNREGQSRFVNESVTWSAVRSRALEFMIIEVSRNVSFHAVKAVTYDSVDLSIVDEFSIVRRV